jgi:hypothetical protein
MTEPVDVIAPGIGVSRTEAFLIRWFDEECRVHQTQCEAPTADIALAVFRQAFRGRRPAAIRRVEGPESSIGKQLEYLRRAIANPV